MFRTIFCLYIDEASTVYACFLDLSKTFERVSHQKLLNKLQEMNLTRILYILLRYVLANSFASVQVGKCQSARWRTSRGVTQGGVFSAYLFNIYINSILEYVSSNEKGCKLWIEKRNDKPMPMT